MFEPSQPLRGRSRSSGYPAEYSADMRKSGNMRRSDGVRGRALIGPLSTPEGSIWDNQIRWGLLKFSAVKQATCRARTVIDHREIVSCQRISSRVRMYVQRGGQWEHQWRSRQTLRHFAVEP